MFKWYGSGGVDFKDDIHLKLFNLKDEKSVIKCEFVKDQKTALEIQHKYFDGLCLAWVIS